MESNSLKSSSATLEMESEGSDLTNDKILSFEPADLLNKERYELYQNAIKEKLKRTKLDYLKVAPQDRVDMSSLILDEPELEEDDERICVSPSKKKEIKSRLKSIRKKYAESLQLIEEMPVEFSENFTKIKVDDDDDFIENGDLRICLNNSFRKVNFQNLKKFKEEKIEKENLRRENLEEMNPGTKITEEVKVNYAQFSEEIKGKTGVLEEVLSAFETKEGKIKKIQDAENVVKLSKFSLKNFKKNLVPSKALSKNINKNKSKEPLNFSYRNKENSFYSQYNSPNEIISSPVKEKKKSRSKSKLNSPTGKKVKVHPSKKNEGKKRKKNSRISFNSNRNYHSDKIINLNFRKPNFEKETKIKECLKNRKTSREKKIQSPSIKRDNNKNSGSKKSQKPPFNSPRKNIFKFEISKSRSQDPKGRSQKIIRRITELKKKSKREMKKNKSFFIFNSKSKRKSFKSDKKIDSLNISKIEKKVNLMSSSKKYTDRAKHNSYIEKRNIKNISKFDIGKTKQVVKKIQENRKDLRIKLLEETIFQQNELIKKLLGYMKEDKEKVLQGEVETLKSENNELKVKLLKFEENHVDIKNIR